MTSLLLQPTGYSFGTPQADQYAAQVPPPPTTPGAAPLGFAPATTPTQDLSKAPTGQPDFPYSQYGKNSIVQFAALFSPVSLKLTPPRPCLSCRSISAIVRQAGACSWYRLAWNAPHAYMLLAHMKALVLSVRLFQLGCGLVKRLVG